jgi:hypothetical protein
MERHGRTSHRKRWRFLGLAALAWLIFRSGSKPSRLVYPCQQAALSTASLVFGASTVAAVVGWRRRFPRTLPAAAALVIAAAAFATALGLWGFRSAADVPSAPAAPDDYRATVFHKTSCAQALRGDHFPGLDDLVEMMGGGGLKFYRSATASLTAGPDGILAAGDTVVVKINYQWPERGGTSTDLLRGLIRKIFDHPEGFNGEVVVCENAQFSSTENFDRAENNAEDPAQSPHDVVMRFKSLGYKISHYDWTAIRYTPVGEYSSGDLVDGYIVGPFDSRYRGRTSYPKFRTEYGTRISLRYGLWDPATGYDRARLKFINVPVLKSHHSTYGATACTKHYMGVVTGELSTNSHIGIGYGILGAVMGEIGLADLNLLDCIWINANPYSGPATTYEEATRRDRLVASRDPIAADIWSVKYILTPAFVENGYPRPWPQPSADPDDPNSEFRRYLDRSMGFILQSGREVTNDVAKIDLVDLGPPGEPSDPDGTGAPFTIAKHVSGYELRWSAPVRGGPAGTYNLYRTDLSRAAGQAAPECEAPLGDGTSAILADLPDNHGFLVVGRNTAGDGSFGHDSRDRERPSPAPGNSCP